MNTSKWLAMFVIFLVIVSTAVAQEERRILATPLPCPHPIALTITAPPPSPPTLDPHDFLGTLGTAVAGSVWNQTQPNKGFGHSFHFPAPLPGKDCCLMTKGTLIVTVKALQGGPKGSSTSANDFVEVVQAGHSVPGLAQQPFPNGATTGQIATVTIQIPQNILSTGVVSFYVEDDCAVLKAELRLEGCCLK
ncbi:MAG TPA: hypothetical protein VG323_04460 [Thermoanaerobaculia bacterium]|nr:hypothetical protein [Thermoanaerobaculia bacterium]